MSIEILECVQQLYDILNFPQTSIAYFQLFKRELGFLHTFLSLQRLTDEPNNSFLLDVAQKVQALLLDDAVKFSELYLTEQFDFYISEVLNQLWLTKIEIRSRYSFPKITLLPTSSKVVTEFIPSVLQNLSNVPKIGYDPCSLLYLPETILKHIEDVSKELKLLQNFVSFVSGRFNIESQISQHHGFVTAFFTHVLAVAGHASMLAWLYLPDHASGNQCLAPEEINVLFSDFLQTRIKPIQPCIRKIYVDVLEALKSTIQSGCFPNIQNEQGANSEASFVETILHNLVELPANGNSSQSVALKDHLTILQEMLNLLRANIIQVPIQDREFPLRDTVVIDIGLLVYWLYEGEEENEEMNTTLGNMSSVIYLITRKAFQSNLPRICGIGYVDFLLNNLKEFQSRYSDSLASVMNQLQMIHKELEGVQPFLKVLEEKGHDKLGRLCEHYATPLIRQAYEVEYVMDAHISKNVPYWCLEHWLSDIIEEITHIRAEVAGIQEKEMPEHTLNTAIAATSTQLNKTPRMSEKIVGFDDVIEKLRGQLINGIRGRDVISIVGMPGLGKTTLAYKLYSDESVVSHFDIRAQCCVSQVYSRKDLLVAILRDAIGKSFKLTKDCANELADDAIGENSKRTEKSAHELADDATDENSKRTEKSADELADELRKTIFQRRYLILVDDVWENSVWDDLRGCFHDANNGSRIILTTRNKEVADYARFQSDPLHLRMFNDDESLKLLSLKVFGEETSSPLLADVGRKIAKQCGQLPLSLSLVGGILAQKEKKEEWEEVAKDLGQYIHSDSKAVIEQSYQNLPYHLRSCFLYFAAFSEDSLITVSKLTTLWISEGLIKGCEGKSTEDTAKGYLENLIGRNLVKVAKTSSDGEVKACRIHDLLHDFTKERAEEMNFLQRIERDRNSYSSIRSHKQHARSVHIHEEEGFKECSSSWSLVGSVIFHRSSSSGCKVSHILYNFKFLKVLDLGTANVDSFPTELVYLRYISASTSLQSIPSSIANNWNLESLMIKNRKDHMSLPITIWKLVKLRHLVGSIFSVGKELLQNSSALYDLRTLYTPQFDCVKDANLMLTETPNLRKLRCIFKNLEDSQYHVLYCPTQLETLKIFPPKFSFLPYGSLYLRISAPNIQNLSLSHFILDLQHLSDIAQLENLQVLKLKNIGFPGEWEVRDEGFPKLKVLKVVGCRSLQKWTADDAFPELERLFLRRCKYLQGIPSCFEDICTLKSIEIVNCSRAVIKAARKIQKIQVEDMQRPCELSISY